MGVPQLLMLYNARFHARTIRDHVERLRTKGFVWWGRFYNGPARFDPTAARARWPHVAQLAGAQVISKEPLLLFASNHVSLHVFKVTRVLLGDDPGDGARKDALPYYAGKSVPIWFRVTDSRALSYDHGTTNDWLEQRLGPVLDGSTRVGGEPFTAAFDPAAAVLHRFPIVIDGPRCEELFDPRNMPKGTRRWAEAQDAMSSRPVQKALDELAKLMEPSVWKRLGSEAKEIFANAWVTRGYLERDADIDPRSGFNDVARAVEVELRDELLARFEPLVKARGSAQLREAMAEARGTDGRGAPKPWTMGSAVKLLKEIATHHRREIETIGLGAMVKLSLEMRWLLEVLDLRNVTMHAVVDERGDGKKESRAILFRFFERRGVDLVPVLEARDGLGVAKGAREKGR